MGRKEALTYATTWMNPEDILLSNKAKAVPPWGLFWGSEGLCGGCIQLAGCERAVGFWAIPWDRTEEGTLLLSNLPLGEALPSQDALSWMQLSVYTSLNILWPCLRAVPHLQVAVFVSCGSLFP